LSRKNIIFFALLILLILGIFLSLALGSVAIPFAEVFKALFGLETKEAVQSTIVWQLRMPRTLAAMLAGAALSISGLLMQTFFRNPIAGPFVLGISSGAGLGAAIWIMGAGLLVQWGLISTASLYGSWALVLSACMGAALVLVILLLVSRRMPDVNTLLILGLMLGSSVSALVMILQFFSGKQELQRFILWSMGDLGSLTWQELSILSPIVIIGISFALLLAQPLNAMLLGETYAKSLGVSVNQLRRHIIIITAILAGSITAFCGPIAFVGIAVPHIARLLWRTQRHQTLIGGSLLLGMLVLLYCQLLAQLPLKDNILPINAVTSLLGAPIVIWIVISIRQTNR
jgi:iron complex transport system permease protein